MSTNKTIKVRCKAFSGEGVRENKVMIEPGRTIRVWDSVAGHYTSCHSLSPSAVRRILRMAADA
jgi:hypothetical protein